MYWIIGGQLVNRTHWLGLPPHKAGWTGWRWKGFLKQMKTNVSWNGAAWSWCVFTAYLTSCTVYLLESIELISLSSLLHLLHYVYLWVEAISVFVSFHHFCVIEFLQTFCFSSNVYAWLMQEWFVWSFILHSIGLCCFSIGKQSQCAAITMCPIQWMKSRSEDNWA